MYSELFWTHVRHPKNRHSMPDSQIGSGRYQRCGDRLKLYLKVDDGRITQASFEARACAPVIAVASLCTEMLQGMEVEAALKLSVFEMDKKLGGLPPSKRHAYLIFLECLNDALTSKNLN